MDANKHINTYLIVNFAALSGYKEKFTLKTSCTSRTTIAKLAFEAWMA